jgi:hypothetical protein
LDGGRLVPANDCVAAKNNIAHKIANKPACCQVACLTRLRILKSLVGVYDVWHRFVWRDDGAILFTRAALSQKAPDIRNGTESRCESTES